MRSAVVRKDERRAEKLRQVGRRIQNGSSMVVQMTPVKRAALVRRHYSRRSADAMASERASTATISLSTGTVL
jgi:hypothetical protein